MKDSTELSSVNYMSVRSAIEKLSELAADSLIFGRTANAAIDMGIWCQSHGPPGTRYSSGPRHVHWPSGGTTIAMSVERAMVGVRGLSIGAVWLSNLTPESWENWSYVEMALRLDPMLVIATQTEKQVRY